MAAQAFAFEQALQVVDMRPVLGCGLFGQALVILGHMGQAKVIEMGGQSGGRIHGWS